MEPLISWGIMAAVFYFLFLSTNKKKPAKRSSHPTPTTANALEEVIRNILQQSSQNTASNSNPYKYTNTEVIKTAGRHIEEIYSEGINPERTRQSTPKQAKKGSNKQIEEIYLEGINPERTRQSTPKQAKKNKHKKPQASNLTSATTTEPVVRKRTQISIPRPNPIAESLREREMLRNAFIASEIFKRKF